MRLIPAISDAQVDSETAVAINEQLHELSGMSMGELGQRLLDLLKTYMPFMVSAALFFVLGFVLIRILMRFLKKMLKTSKTDETLHGFILSTVRIVLYVILAITCVGILGVNFTPLITALGALGLAVSLAVRDILANLAGGISVLFSRPFAKGDYVEINGQPGTIREIGMAYTILQTVDNKKTYLPNGDVAKATIINYSAEPNRRLDLPFYVKQSSDFELAKQLALQVVDREPLALKDPKPAVRLTDQTYGYVKMTVFVWSKNAELFELKSRLISDIRCILREQDL